MGVVFVGYGGFLCFFPCRARVERWERGAWCGSVFSWGMFFKRKGPIITLCGEILARGLAPILADATLPACLPSYLPPSLPPSLGLRWMEGCVREVVKASRR